MLCESDAWEGFAAAKIAVRVPCRLGRWYDETIDDGESAPETVGTNVVRGSDRLPIPHR
jgi:hypothetical protein